MGSMPFCTFFILLLSSASSPISWMMPEIRNHTMPIHIQQLFDEVRFSAGFVQTMPVVATTEKVSGAIVTEVSNIDKVTQVYSNPSETTISGLMHSNLLAFMPVLCLPVICYSQEDSIASITEESANFSSTEIDLLLSNFTSSAGIQSMKTGTSAGQEIINAAVILLDSLPGALLFTFFSLGKKNYSRYVMASFKGSGFNLFRI